jgi:hypothetical protein
MVAMETGRQAMLDAFSRLFAKTADKLQIRYTDEELTQAKDNFAERMGKVLDVLAEAPVEVTPPDVVSMMEAAVDELSPVQVVAQLAALPLIQHSHLVLQRLAHQAAEQRLLESALDHVDTTYGGN